tara:strand:+ start:7149 stop:8243 length:1095 start_codon:yes stop_codon:yes gene_type:complete
MPNPMRYLVVPSKETEKWRDFLISNDWLERGYNIQKENEQRALPLSDLFPEILPPLLSKFKIIEKVTSAPLPSNYLGFLKEKIGENILKKYAQYWPQSFDQIGEIIIVKIDEHIEKYATEIAEALLLQNNNSTRVFQDLGVKGDFRIRNLKLIGGSKELKGETKVKENGAEFIVDPTKGYYSPRLATERLQTLECAIILKKQLGRGLNVCDAYAGFGPALMPFFIEKGLVNHILANDLNPEITLLLEKNIIKNNKEDISVNIKCEDAKNLILDVENKGFYDLLLVNIPHSTLEHLPSLIGLLNRGSSSLLRAWCIIDSNKISEVKTEINKMFNSQTFAISKLIVEPTRTYSPTQVYAKIEVWIN